MGRQSSELVGKETAPQTTDSSALSAIGNSKDLVAGLKQKTGADEIIADGYIPPANQGGKYDQYTNYAPRPRTNQDKVNDLLNPPAANCAPSDTPAPAPVPVADSGCPTQCKDVQTPAGYQVLNQPLAPGQVMREPDNWTSAGDQTNAKIMSDTINYSNTNGQDSRGKVLQNDRYQAETQEYVENSKHAREQDAKDRGANRFATKVGAIGNFAESLGRGAYSTEMGISSIVYSSKMGGRYGGAGYGYGGGYGGMYPGGGMCGGYGGPMLGPGGFGGGFGGGYGGGGYGYGYPARGFMGSMVPYGNQSIYYNGGINFPPPGNNFTPGQVQPMAAPRATGTEPYRKCDQICDPKQPQQQPEYSYPNKRR